MDQQHHHHQLPNDPNANHYGFYPTEQDPSYSMGYNAAPMTSYQIPVQHNAPQARHLDLQQPGIQQYHHNLTLISPHQYQPPVYPPSPPHVSLPLSTTTPPPPSPEMYDPLSPPLSGSETSADGIYHHSNSSGNNSPSSSRANSLVHRQIRYNPTPSPTSSSGRRRRGRSQDSDDEDINMHFNVENLAHTRKEATRRQRIEAEQRRRDELRDGYAKLKDVLPVSTQKSSKVSLLDRATSHIVTLESQNKEMQERIKNLEDEIQRLRGINEKFSGNSATETPSPGMFGGRPLSPPPDVPLHSLASVRGQEPHSEGSSPSASDSGF